MGPTIHQQPAHHPTVIGHYLRLCSSSWALPSLNDINARSCLTNSSTHSAPLNGATLLLIREIARDRELTRRLVFTWAQIRARTRNPVNYILLMLKQSNQWIGSVGRAPDYGGEVRKHAVKRHRIPAFLSLSDR